MLQGMAGCVCSCLLKNASCFSETRLPQVVARRRCIATNCICETEFDTKEISCDIKDYEFVPQCGAPAAALESLEDIT